MANVITCYVGKGGNSKSSWIHNVSGALQALKKKVLVIDTDMQANVSMYFGVDESMPSLYELLNAECNIADAIQNIRGIDIVRGSNLLSRCDKEFDELDDRFILKDFVDAVRDQYDYILIDCSPAKNMLNTSALMAADYVVVPTECDDGSIAGVYGVLEDLRKLKEGRIKLSDAKLLMIVVSKYENTVIHKMTYERMEELVKERNDGSIVEKVRKNIAVTECKNFKQTLQEYNKNCSAGRDFYRIAKEIVARCES